MNNYILQFLWMSTYTPTLNSPDVRSLSQNGGENNESSRTVWK